MDIFASAATLAPAAVLVGTELIKLVPVQFTSRYPALVNALLSIVAAVIVVKPSLNLEDIGQTFGSALLIGAVAAGSYNSFVSRIKPKSA